MRCNICYCDEFEAMGSRPFAKCKNCLSLERTRLLYLHLERFPFSEQTKVLHIAPEKGIYQRLSKILPPENYVTADFEPRRYPYVKKMVKIDLCDLDDFPSREFDLIMHSHVLEHTPCNIAYSLWHLHRMLKPDGLHLCVIPFLSGCYDESFQALSDEEKTRRFGQFDHVRRFGRDDLHTHLGKLMKLPERYDASNEFDKTVLIEANIPPATWRGFTASTVLRLRRNDMKLLSPEM